MSPVANLYLHVFKSGQQRKTYFVHQLRRKKLVEKNPVTTDIIE